MKIHEWKNRELSRLLMEKFNISEKKDFPDLSGDGEVSQKDVLIAKGVIDKPEGEDEDLEEGVASELGHIALDIAGFVPVIGDPADLTNAVWYTVEAEKHRNNGDGYEAFFAYLFAALSVVSLAGALIPVLGDALPKGTKYTAQIARFSKFAKAGGSEAKALRTNLIKNKAKLDAVIKQASGKEGRLSSAAPYMMAAMGMFISNKIPNQGDGVETLEAEASGGQEDVDAVVDLGSEEGEEGITELRNYIIDIIQNN